MYMYWQTSALLAFGESLHLKALHAWRGHHRLRLRCRRLLRRERDIVQPASKRRAAGCATAEQPNTIRATENRRLERGAVARKRGDLRGGPRELPPQTLSMSSACGPSAQSTKPQRKHTERRQRAYAVAGESKAVFHRAEAETLHRHRQASLAVHQVAPVFGRRVVAGGRALQHCRLRLVRFLQPAAHGGQRSRSAKTRRQTRIDSKAVGPARAEPARTHLLLHAPARAVRNQPRLFPRAHRGVHNRPRTKVAQSRRRTRLVHIQHTASTTTDI